MSFVGSKNKVALPSVSHETTRVSAGGLASLKARALRALGVLAGAALVVGAPAAHGRPVPDAPGRAYEVVSPADKNGGPVTIAIQGSRDGHAIAWSSNTAYGGATGIALDTSHAARRSATGWQSTPFTAVYQGDDAPPSLPNALKSKVFDDDLTRMFMSTSAGLVGGDADSGAFEGGQNDVYALGGWGATEWVSRPADGSPSTAANTATLVGYSGDGTSVFFTSDEHLTADIPVASTAVHLYRSRAGQVTAVDRDVSGAVIDAGGWLGTMTPLGAYSGGGINGPLPDADAVSRDGTRFIYQSTTTETEVNADRQLYLHRDGAPPKLISASQRSGTVGQPAPSGAKMLAALDDAQRILLRSPDQLTDDAPAGGGVYLYDTRSSSLTYVFPDKSDGTAPQFVAAADDASRLYFLSTDVLAPGATTGEPNIYVRSATEIRFVAALAAQDVAQGSETIGYVDTTPDGGKLVFQASHALTSTDTGSFGTVYVYDDSTRTIACVSCRADGSPSQASSTLSYSGQAGITAPPRSITDDGKEAFFTSTDALVAKDTNGVQDVYRYADGKPLLVSTGASPRESWLIDSAPDGQDVFFITVDSLDPRDGDGGSADIYDARRGGGFPDPPPAVECADDACQGPAPQRSTPAPIGQLTGPEDAVVPLRARFTVKSVSSVRRRTAAATGRLVVSVDVNQSGKLSLTAGAKVSSRTQTIGSTAVQAARAGTVNLRVTLSTAARRQLSRTGSLTVTATVRFEGVTAARRATVKLTRKVRAR